MISNDWGQTIAQEALSNINSTAWLVDVAGHDTCNIFCGDVFSNLGISLDVYNIGEYASTADFTSNSKVAKNAFNDSGFTEVQDPKNNVQVGDILSIRRNNGTGHVVIITTIENGVIKGTGTSWPSYINPNIPTARADYGVIQETKFAHKSIHGDYNYPRVRVWRYNQ